MKKLTRKQLREEFLKLQGWTEVEGPKTDYDGPCEWGMILVPPEGVPRGYSFPPRGKIGYEYFYGGTPDPTQDLAAAWKFINEMNRDTTITVTTYRNNAAVIWGEEAPLTIIKSSSPQLAICLAYLQWKTGEAVELLD